MPSDKVLMRCPICDNQEYHILVGAHSRSKIQVCKKCGFLCHDVDPSEEAKVREFYRNGYKPTLGIAAVVTASNKLQYITKFLAEHLEGKSGLICADVGAATGYVLNYLRQRGHKVTGSEWTLTNRRLSEHFYGIPLTEELSEKRKYDLLSMYHVVEHLIEPDKKLAKYVGLLAEGGRIMISTPKWLGLLEQESGASIIGPGRATPQESFDDLFHKNHINLFSVRALLNLFGKAGLTVVKEDLRCYGQTYLLRAGDKKPFEPEDWQAVIEIVNGQRKAIEFFSLAKYQDAVKVYPLFPEGWIALIFGVYGKDPERQSDMLQQVPAKVRMSWRFKAAEAQWLARLERLDESLVILGECMDMRFQVELLFLSAEILTRQGKYKEGMAAFAKCAELHPHRWQDCYQWIITNATKMQTWDEKAREQVQKLIMDKAMAEGAITVQDPEPVGFQLAGQQGGTRTVPQAVPQTIPQAVQQDTKK